MPSVISYMIVWFARLREVNKIMHLQILLNRDCTSYMILLVQCILWLVVKQAFICYVCHAASVLMIMVLYYKDIIYILRKNKKG